MARERQIFDTDMLAHVWASREQDCGRNASRGRENMYFVGATIFSYGSHFPLATFARVRPQLEVVFVNRDSYSMTTSRHQSAVESALPRVDYSVFHVSTDFLKAWERFGYRFQCLELTGEELGEWEKSKRREWRECVRREAREQIAKVRKEFESAKRWRSHWEGRLERFLARAPRAIDKAFELLKTCGIKPLKREEREWFKLQLAITAPEWQERYQARVARAENLQLAKERDYPMRFALERDWGKMSKEHWRRGESIKRGRTLSDKFISWETRQKAKEHLCLPRVYGYDYSSRAHGSALLRCKGEQVNTSLGADFPLAHYRRAVAYFKALAARFLPPFDLTGKPKTFSNARLGHFHVDSFSWAGVRAGCHFVSWVEINFFNAEIGEPIFNPQEAKALDGARFERESERR